MNVLKASIVSLVLMMWVCVFSQESEKQETGPVIYSVFYNDVPGGFKFPLVGFINITRGDYNNAQIGFVDMTNGNMKGMQIGFVGLTQGYFKGTQINFLNVIGESAVGAQVGFVNLTKKDFNGSQIGFVNVAGGETTGAQIGFVNATKSVKGTQIGFVNATKKLKGFQLGFVNYADSLESGLALGFLSFIRKGGYKAVEVGVSEMFPVNVSLKTGTKNLYTSIIASYNNDYKKSTWGNGFSLGAGVGSILSVGPSVYLNPELTWQELDYKDNNYNHLTSFALNIGYSIVKGLDIVAGTSLNWYYSDNGQFETPLYSLYEHKFDKQSRLIGGLRLALRVNF